MRSPWTYVPGASPGAPRRNALLLLLYAVLLLLLWGLVVGGRAGVSFVMSEEQ